MRPHRAHRPLHPGADRRRDRPGGDRRSASRNPHAAGGAETLRKAGVDVESGVRQAEVEAGNIAWLTAVRRRRPYLIWKYRRHPGRPVGRGRRHQPVDHLPRRAADVHATARHRRRDHRRGRHGARRRPPADRPQPARGAWPSASRCGWWWTPTGGPHRTRGCATAPRPPGSPPPPSSAPRPTAGSTSPTWWSAVRAGRAGAALLEGGPDPGRRVPAAGLVDGWSATWPRSCSAPAGGARSTPGSTTDRRRPSTLELIDIAPGADRTCGSPPCPTRGGLSMFTGIVEELGEVVAHRRHGRRAPSSRCAARW